MEDKFEFQKQKQGDILTVKISGRIDSYWSEHLTTLLKDEVHAGSYNISLNLDDIIFISSAGIRVLVQYYKQLKSLNGSLAIVSCSESVRKILDMSGLSQLFFRLPEKQVRTIEEKPEAKHKFGNYSCTVKALSEGIKMDCRLIGNPDRLAGADFSPEDIINEKFGTGKFAIGLGAIGNDFEDCKNRFGECLASSGAVAHLPTGAKAKADYDLAAGNFIPELKMLYGLVFEGSFSHFIRFEANQMEQVAFDSLIEGCLSVAGLDCAAIVIAAEAAGLVGAALERLPAMGSAGSTIFDFPAVRDHIGFTTERAYPNSHVLAVGVVVPKDRSGTDIKLIKLLRQVSRQSSYMSHFHAAVFSYYPLKKEVSDAGEVTHTLFGNAPLQSVLHLVCDDRDIVGVGQSEFIRGMVWLGRIDV